MGLFEKLKTNNIDYNTIDAVTVQTNLLMCTETQEHQKAIKKLRVGSLVDLTRKRRNGQTVYVVSDYKTGSVIGEISYGTSEYLSQNYKGYKMLGKVTEIGKLTPLGVGKQVSIEYKVYL